MTVTERVAYLKGLAAGMDVDTGKKEGKLLMAVIDVLDELANSVTDLEAQNAELSEDLDELYEELSDIEEDLFDVDDDDEDEMDLEDELYQVICPTCGESIYLDDELLAEGSISCPACGEELEFDLSELTDEEIQDSIVDSITD